MMLPEEDITTHVTRSQLFDRIGVSLGGRVAEEIVYGEITTGAQNDLEKSTKLARRMVTEFGMSDRLGPLTFGKRHEHVFLGRDFGHERDYGENVAALIDEEVTRIVSDQYKRVQELLSSHRPHMDAIVEVLVKKETLDAKEVQEIMRQVDAKLKDGSEADEGSEDPPGAPGEGITLTVEGQEKEPAASKGSGEEVPGSGPDKTPEFKPKFA